ncbi:phosphatase PAP2 family protein [Streptomyces sp. NBC_01264]|uniref:phosphatase PAP2 family protein n=1 Tax=Streptomyces sp. NBC_01264 TaxID=2903804 RepID=UPI002255867C|nr:phosphatase PAP2 family protein [Streptomyces sp. NBC_01264]MCX4775982.1 phosphatase PAP2 family protein [Streptomyces sp. NBC_01264]
MSPTGTPPRLRARWAALVLFAVLFILLTTELAARHGAPYAVDRAVHRWALEHRPPALTSGLRLLAATGTGPLPYLCAAGAGWIAGHDDRSRLRAAAYATAFLVAAQAARYALVYSLARVRPPAADWATHASGFAFPSGHSATSALVAGLLALSLCRRTGPAAHRRIRVLLGCWAVGVALSRVCLGVHWPTDILGGWLYALIWLSAAAAWLRSGPGARPFGPATAPVRTDGR